VRVAHDAQPLRTVARLTGLSPDVIRAWEKRYGVVRPVRGPRGARLYSNADVEHLRLLGRAVRSGRAIGDVARMPKTALARFAPPAPTVDRDVAADPLESLLAALGRFDAPALDRGLGDALMALGLREFAGRVVGPLLETVGARSMAGDLSYADEHLLSAIIRNLLTGIMRARGSGARPAVLMATPAGERHEFGLLLASLHLLEAGLGVCYLGTDLPAEQIAGAAVRAGVHAVGIGVVDGTNRARAATELRALARALPGGVELWIGGRDARPVRQEARLPRVLLLNDVGELEREARRLAAVATRMEA